ncbi:hypothetical protein A2574_00215 [Candidatus Shapirobacteria bacterium RIFOXYD1_FULL_38_32]|uniref:Peptidase MA-like domain-containing protein n=4 Tax=Patescibacteria group TaxID=1783273 RepID=A0A0G0M797_9BACT|nr:MAG: hypothetical protein US90_C0015G0017 [Candidatus Shapirobacteria bacterium GW2011_GWE2_38_30]KKQ90766.1 MAG: hypothetical protein UT14_C0029G0002 [Candidatus Shapirobacteria bacterium GW2011_GWE1_38_92]OGJ06251.1 MAG: hypothetical protein A2192_00575 [Candidatus Nomurabacteria bacterium RIFOXYA1_FULL_35_17]OGL56161.1 MAG: hypothetical protein A2410_02930 [Candidatus Shapirobacteria bacterium RIFOXYC1_FULL_38_24]OGL57840.1 MAG: hypothetical protein A2367_01735 [Candidatus Shapirobacteria
MDHYSLQVLPINKHYQDTIDQAVMEFEKYFEVKLKHKICLIFLNSRQEFDDIVGRKTQPFETAFSIYNLTFLMSEKVYNQESNKKFDLQKNLLTLRHEICHKYFQTITRRSQPVWLNEGISIYLSGQLTNYKKVGKLSNFLLFESTNFIDGKDVYQESGFVVEKLVTKFGKEKLLDLLKSIRKTSDNSQFPKVFNKIYGFELNYDNINNL